MRIHDNLRGDNNMPFIRFRKGELQFYKGCTPKEIKKYLKNHPENEQYVTKFLDNYTYNYVKQEWRKT